MSLCVADSFDLGLARFDFVGAGNIWVDDSLVDDSSVRFVQYLIGNALTHTSPGQLEIIAFDDSLTGLVAPFQEINNGGERLLKVVNSPKELAGVLEYLRRHIQGVANVVQGRSSTLTEFRRAVGKPIEGYKLVVLSADFGLLDDGIQNAVRTLAKAGPRNGVSFVIHAPSLGVNEYFLELFQQVEVSGDVLCDQTGMPIGSFQAPSAEELIDIAYSVQKALVSLPVEIVPFGEIESLVDPWQHNSRDGITFTVGRYGTSAIAITLGDEVNQRHNALVTGAVGQGKSNLISVIVHSLCHRYSPQELQLYLLDFKEGVTLQRFTDGPAGEYLPHARVLGLEADREFGLAVLTHLFAIYSSRMKEFKRAGVQSVREYRTKYPDAVMPRIVLFVDEFQMMFAERDKISDQIADLLQRGVRLFRACGIHIVLSSQTIGGNNSLIGSAAEGLFGQVPVRIALKNSIAESHATLGSRNDAAAHLRSREAIVNLDYGEVSQNRKTSIAFADEEVLAPMRHSWWIAASSTPAPYVFNGERALCLEDSNGMIGNLTQPSGQSPLALFGQQIEVGGTVLGVAMNNDAGRNVAIVGPSNAAIPLANALRGLSLQPHVGEVEVVVLDFLHVNEQWEVAREQLYADLVGAGVSLRLIAPEDAGATLTELAERVDATPSSSPLTRTSYVLGLGMERLRDVDRLPDLCRNGPGGGIHILGWWMKADAFNEQVGYGGAAYFDVKAAYGLDTQTTRRFIDEPLLEWRPRANRMIIWDSASMPAPVRVIPYTRYPGVNDDCRN